MPASWGQRSRARAARRWRSEILVESGGVAIAAIVPYRLAAPWGLAPRLVPGACPVGREQVRIPSSPYVVCLGDGDRAELESVSRRATAPFRLVMRARIVLLAADGLPNCVIAERLGICRDTARKWRRRYCERGMDGLADAPRPGRPRVFPARVVAEVKALACELPAASGTPLARCTCPELPRHAVASGIVEAVSASTVRRWLDDDAIRPWQHRSWILPRDPHFAVKAGRVLDLYQREWEGEPPGEDESCSAPARSQAPRHARASTCRSRQGPGGLCVPTASMPAAAPWPAWPPTTSTALRSRAGASPPPASGRSPPWWSR